MARHAYPWCLLVVLAFGTAHAISLGEQPTLLQTDACDSVFPQWQGHWTGFVRFNDGVYHKQSTTFATISSRNTTTESDRGWAKFDLAAIPDDALIAAAALRHNVSQIQPNGASIELRLMTSDPASESCGQTLWNEITNGPVVSDPLPIPLQAVPVWVTQELNATAVAALQARLSTNWIAFGFNETEPDADCGLQSYGWNNSSRRPRLVISYTLPVDIRALDCGLSTYPLAIGQSEVVWARVANYGTNTALDTKVTALVDDLPFDSLTLPRLEPSRETTVTFSYRSPGPVPARRYFTVAAHNPAEQLHVNDTVRFDDWLYPAGTYQAEGFDRTTQTLPPGWVTLTNDGGSYNWTRVTGSQAHSGSAFARCSYEFSQPTDDWLVSPPLVLPPGFADSIGLYVRTQNASPADTLEVWALSGQQLTDTVARLRSLAVGSTAYAEVGASLEELAGQTVCIGLRKIGTSLNQLIVDDFWCMRQTGEDVGVSSIIEPAGSVTQGTYLHPAVCVRNHGIYDATFDVRLTIRRDGVPLFDTTESGVSLATGDSAFRTFAAGWTVPEPGTYDVVSHTVLGRDQDPSNDTARKTVTAALPPTGGWEELPPLTTDPSTKMVKDGGWLAYSPATGRVMAAKGNKTPDFYSFDLSSSQWLNRSPVPAGSKSRGYFGKGSAACSDGAATVYAAKGSGTLEFWRYRIPLDSWDRLKDVPVGPNKKTVKGGADIVFAGSGPAARAYLLKGPSAEFLSYDPAMDSWEALAPAPNATHKWAPGSFLVFDGDRTIYAHKPKFHELWTYDIVGRTWSTRPLTGMPFIGASGRSRTAKDGSAGAWADNSIYAFKGGNTQEFWRYLPSSDSWVWVEPIPAIGRDGRKKLVKAGGDLTAAHGRIYALKGNKSLEFWMYQPASQYSPRPDAGGATAVAGVVGQVGLTVPGITRGDRLPVRFELSAPGEADARLYDAAGRSVLHQSLGRVRGGTVVLDVRSLPSGVYALRLETRSQCVTRRVVISR